jgi:branched-chain amino acid transport system ATP-binding protein
VVAVTTPVLRAAGLSVSYGGIGALSDFDLEVPDRSLIGLIGPNGAGKTTFIDAVTGFTRSTGTLELAGADLRGLGPDARARRGLSRTWQSIELFEELTVGENLAIAAYRPSVRQALREILTGRPPKGDRIEAVLEALGLRHLADERSEDLTQGQRKLVGVARALVARPRVLLLDEPAAGLDTSESDALGRRLRDVVDSGVPILLIDHDMGLVLGVCDYVYVLDFGRKIAEGTPREVRANHTVIDAYLGGAAAGVREEAAGT